jgi:hypothetical protein
VLQRLSGGGDSAKPSKSLVTGKSADSPNLVSLRLGGHEHAHRTPSAPNPPQTEDSRIQEAVPTWKQVLHVLGSKPEPNCRVSMSTRTKPQEILVDKSKLIGYSPPGLPQGARTAAVSRSM